MAGVTITVLTRLSLILQIWKAACNWSHLMRYRLEVDKNNSKDYRTESIYGFDWRAVRFGQTLGVAGLIIALESTIYWNGITGVNTLGSTGQWFAFLYGLLGLIQFAFTVYIKKNPVLHARPKRRVHRRTDRLHSTTKELQPGATFGLESGDHDT